MIEGPAIQLRDLLHSIREGKAGPNQCPVLVDRIKVLGERIGLNDKTKELITIAYNIARASLEEKQRKAPYDI